MGSFGWDDHSYTQFHEGRPLSVALTEPCRCQSKCFTDSDFTLERCDTNVRRARSRSIGGGCRRFKREAYSIYNPNVQYATYYCQPTFFHRSMDHGFGRDCFVEKYMTFEEEQCRPTHNVISYVRETSPVVRQVKIRSRPSSCVDLHKREATDNQWKKVVDERTEERYNYHFNYTPPAEKLVTIEKPAAAIFRYDATTGTDDLYVKPKPVRPATRDASTETIKRPLSISETQVIERYEKDEKVRRDLAAETTSTTYITMEQQQAVKPVQRTYEDIVTETTSTSYETQQQQQQQEAIQHSYGSSMSERASSGGFMATQVKPIQHSYSSSIKEKSSSGGFSSAQAIPLKHSHGSSITEKSSSDGFSFAQAIPLKHSYGSSITETSNSGGYTSTHAKPVQHSYSSITETSGGSRGFISSPLRHLDRSLDNEAIGTSSSSYSATYHQPIHRSYDSSVTGKSSGGYLTTHQLPIHRSYDSSVTEKSGGGYLTTHQQPIHRTFDTSVLGTSSSSYSASQYQPTYHSSEEDDISDDHYQRVNKKTHRKEFVQRMHARNGTGLRSYNSFNTHGGSGRSRTIVRPTAKPREALVDTPGITGNPGDISEPSTPTVLFERSRNYFQST